MSKTGILLWLLWTLCSVSASARAEDKLQWFAEYAQSIPDVPGYRVQAFFLKEGERALQALNSNLPNQPAQAKAEALRRLNSTDRQLIQTIAHARLGQMLYQRYQLKRLPAYVFNQTVVVYDQPTLTAAIREYESWRNE